MIARAILPTEESALVEFFRGMRGRVRVAFEEGTQAQWLHDLLEPVVGRRGRALGAAAAGRATRGLSREPGAETHYAELDVLRELRPKVKAAMVAEARRDPAWSVLRSIPYLGPVRVAQLMATMRTPWRFRTKRNLWAYSGLAVVTVSSSDYVIEGCRTVRKRRAPMTRGLNRNHTGC